MSPDGRIADSPDDAIAAGFTLAEVVVALAVAALCIAATYEVISTGLRSASSAAAHGRAVLVAESTLEGLRTEGPIRSIDHSERIDDIYDRRIVARPRPDLSGRSDGGVELVPYELVVTVSWREGRRPRSIILTTLALGLAE